MDVEDAVANGDGGADGMKGNVAGGFDRSPRIGDPVVHVDDVAGQRTTARLLPSPQVRFISDLDGDEPFSDGPLLRRCPVCLRRLFKAQRPAVYHVT